MKILSIGNFSGRGWDGSITDENHIADALEELGHEVIREQRNSYFTEADPPPYDNIDFVLIAQWDGWGSTTRMIEATKHEYGCPVVYWAFDYQTDGQEWHERLVKEADLYLSKRIADSKYPNWQYLSQDFAPKFLASPLQGDGFIGQDIDVLFTGSYLEWATERNETVKAVGDNFNLVIHSVNAWPQGNEGPIMDEGLPNLYARTKVVLSIDHTLEAGYWSDRNAQAMACGATVLFRYVPLSEVVFRNHVVYFYSIEDCLEKIKGLLANPFPLSTKIAKFAQENLMVNNRVRDLLTIVRNHLENRTV